MNIDEKINPLWFKRTSVQTPSQKRSRVYFLVMSLKKIILGMFDYLWMMPTFAYLVCYPLAEVDRSRPLDSVLVRIILISLITYLLYRSFHVIKVLKKCSQNNGLIMTLTYSLICFTPILGDFLYKILPEDMSIIKMLKQLLSMLLYITRPIVIIVIFISTMFFCYDKFGGMGCHDGSYSSSIGHRGACSWHGGVSNPTLVYFFIAVILSCLYGFIAGNMSKKLLNN